MKTLKNFDCSTPLRLMLESFAKATHADTREGWSRVLFELAVRLGQICEGALGPEHMVNFAADPNVPTGEQNLRLSVVKSFWLWATNEELERALGTIREPEGGLGPVLSVEQLRRLLSQTGRPWTIPYLVPRFFLGMEHAAALGFMIGADPSVPEYPVILEQVEERLEERLDLGSAVTRWLEPYRGLRSDEPFIQDPRISAYIAQQAKSVGIVWDDWLPTRTYCAYRLALTNEFQEIAARTGFPDWFVFEAHVGFVNHHDAMQYFELTPRACRRHNWDQEVKQCLEWHAGGFQFGPSLCAQ